MLDFVVLGDVCQDNFFFIEEASVHCGLNNSNCELTLKYGQKIPVRESAICLGGNGANVAVGLSRLGIKAPLCTSFADDEIGVWIKKRLMEENVDLSLSKTVSGFSSNKSALIIFRGERTILTFHSHISREIKIPEAKWLYLTSPSGVSSNELFKAVLGFKGKIAFNPNINDLKNQTDLFKKMLLRTDILLVNDDENKFVGEVKLKIVTMGKGGATICTSGKEIHKNSYIVDVADTTGAGDAFSSGFLSALYYDKDLDTALDWGLKNSASAIQKIGATKGLLNEIN